MTKLLSQPTLLADRARCVYQTIAGREVLAVYDRGHAVAVQEVLPLGSSSPRAGYYHADPAIGRIILGIPPSGEVTCDLGDWLEPALIERGDHAYSATGFLADFAGITPAELDNAADRIVKAIERASTVASAQHGELLQALLGKRRAVA